jgi:hypothetical protein
MHPKILGCQKQHLIIDIRIKLQITLLINAHIRTIINVLYKFMRHSLFILFFFCFAKIKCTAINF